MKLALTGANGFLAYHLRCHLLKYKEFEISLISQSDFNEPQVLAGKVKDADVIIHLAGVNRGTDDEVHFGNVNAAEKLVKALLENVKKPHLLFSNSTHILKDSVYGKSKKQCSDIFGAWAKNSDARFTDVILPHIFGEGGKPFYNSTVSTFCHQIANQQTPEIKVDIELNLVHAGEAAIKFIELALSSAQSPAKINQVMMNGEKIQVSSVLAKLQKYFNSYANEKIIPRFENAFDLKLFNTLRSFMFPKDFPMALKLHTDPRGSLFEAVRTDHGGQAFLSTTKPGITRGQHYHYQKIERFCVIRGEALIQIRKLHTAEIHEYKVSGSEPCFIDMPTLHTHNITNTGTEDLLTLFWSHEIFDPQNPDTYPEIVKI